MKFSPSQVKLYGGCDSVICPDEKDTELIDFIKTFTDSLANSSLFLHLYGKFVHHVCEVKFRDNSLVAIIPENITPEAMDAELITESNLLSPSNDHPALKQLAIQQKAVNFVDDKLRDVCAKITENIQNIDEMTKIFNEIIDCVNEEKTESNSDVVESIDRKVSSLLHMNIDMDKKTEIVLFYRENMESDEIRRKTENIVSKLQKSRLLYTGAYLKRICGISESVDLFFGDDQVEKFFTNLFYYKLESENEQNQNTSLIREYGKGEISVTSRNNSEYFSIEKSVNIIKKIKSNLHSECAVSSDNDLRMTRNLSKTILCDSSLEIKMEDRMSDLDISTDTKSPMNFGRADSNLELNRYYSLKLTEDKLSVDSTARKMLKSDILDVDEAVLSTPWCSPNLTEPSLTTDNDETPIVGEISRESSSASNFEKETQADGSSDETSMEYINHLQTHLQRVVICDKYKEVKPNKKKVGILQKFKSVVMTNKKDQHVAEGVKPIDEISCSELTLKRFRPFKTSMSRKAKEEYLLEEKKKSGNAGKTPVMNSSQIDEVPKEWKSLVDQTFYDSLNRSQIIPQEIFTEIYYSEKSFVQMLRAMHTIYYQHISSTKMLTDSQLNTIMPQILIIFMLHSCMLATISKYREASDKYYIKNIPACIMEMIPEKNVQLFIDAYSKVSSQKEEGKLLYEKLIKSNSKFKSFIQINENNEVLKKFVIPECNDQIAIRPFKYPLWMERMSKYYQAGSEEHTMLKKAKENYDRIVCGVNRKVGEITNQKFLSSCIQKLDVRAKLIGNRTFRYDIDDVFPTDMKLIYNTDVTITYGDKDYFASALVMETHLVFLVEYHGRYGLLNIEKEPPVIPRSKLIVSDLPNKNQAKFYLNCPDFHSPMLITSSDVSDKKLKFHLLDTVITSYNPRFDIINSSVKLNENVRRYCDELYQLMSEINQYTIGFTKNCQYLQEKYSEYAPSFSNESDPDSKWSQIASSYAISTSIIKADELSEENLMSKIYPHKTKIDIFWKFIKELNKCVLSAYRSKLTSPNEDIDFFEKYMSQIKNLECWGTKFYAFYGANTEISKQNFDDYSVNFVISIFKRISDFITNIFDALIKVNIIELI